MRPGPPGHELLAADDRRGGPGAARAGARGAPTLPVILITAWGSIALAVEGMKAGASDFVTKPWTNAADPADRAAPRSAWRPRRRGRAGARRARSSTRASTSATSSARIRGCARCCSWSAASRRPTPRCSSRARAAPARSWSPRRSTATAAAAAAPFVKVNLGGISSTLFESEMFGHVRGAFTDARQDRKGRFEMADGGTIFLDEIGDLDPASQVKLLRVLQDRTFEVLGSSQRRDRRRARRLGHQPQPRRDGGARRVPRGPALPHQPDRVDAAAAARAARTTSRCSPHASCKRGEPGLSPRRGSVSRHDAIAVAAGSSRGRATSGSCGSRSSAPSWSSREDAVSTVADFRRTADMEPGEAGRRSRCRRSAA